MGSILKDGFLSFLTPFQLISDTPRKMSFWPLCIWHVTNNDNRLCALFVCLFVPHAKRVVLLLALSHFTTRIDESGFGGQVHTHTCMQSTGVKYSVIRDSASIQSFYSFALTLCCWRFSFIHREFRR